MRIDELKRIGAAMYLRRGLMPSYNEAYDHASMVVETSIDRDVYLEDIQEEEDAEKFFYEVDISYWEQ